MAEEAQVWEGVQLPADFTPMLVLGRNVLNRLTQRAPELKDLVTSHEFGHTAALIHTMVERNLMFPSVAVGRDNCHDSLDDTQLATMRTTLGVGAAASGALVNAGAAAQVPAAAPRALSAFTPAALRAMLPAIGNALRSLVERCSRPDAAARAMSDQANCGVLEARRTSTTRRLAASGRRFASSRSSSRK